VKKLRITLAAPLFVLAMLAIWLFGMSIFAFGWHLRHGFYHTANGLKFRVPLFYQETRTAETNQFSIQTFRSAISRKDASITVKFSSDLSDRSTEPPSYEEAKSIGMTLLERRTIEMSRRRGDCVVYGKNDLTLNRNPGFSRLWITCRFGKNMETEFEGSAGAVPDFYSFLQTAKEVKQ